jgi:hypothetical protein
MSTPAFTMTISMGNAAFADGEAGRELARILRKLADQIENTSALGGETESGTLFDVNGNLIGPWFAEWPE